MELLLVKDRVVDAGSPGLAWLLLLKEALAARLLVDIGVAEHHLLLRQIARLLVKVATYESSTASGNFHEVLCQFLFLSLCQNGLFLTNGRVCRVCGTLLVLKSMRSLVPHDVCSRLLWLPLS